MAFYIHTENTVFCKTNHQVLATTKPAEPRLTLPIVVHSCYCSIPVHHHRCFLPPLLRFCPGFWRSHVLCSVKGPPIVTNKITRLVDEAIWSDTLDQTPWRTNFDVGERLGVGDVYQNIPHSLIIQHLPVNSKLSYVFRWKWKPLVVFQSYDPLSSSQSEATPAARRGMPTACTKCPWTSLKYCKCIR